MYHAAQPDVCFTWLLSVYVLFYAKETFCIYNKDQQVPKTLMTASLTVFHITPCTCQILWQVNVKHELTRKGSASESIDPCTSMSYLFKLCFGLLLPADNEQNL